MSCSADLPETTKNTSLRVLHRHIFCACNSGDGKQLTDVSKGCSVQQMLYIQMEFCPRTLRQVLDEGPLDSEVCWQVRAPASQPSLHALSCPE
jgi:hypothetical protein